MPGTSINKTLTALAGEFLVAGKLCAQGYLASLTLKNYPKVDIFVLNPKNGQQTTIQVKTIRKKAKNPKYDGYFLPEDIDESAPYFVFVYIIDDEKVNFYIMIKSDIKNISDKIRDDYIEKHKNANPKQPRMLSINDISDYKDKWSSINLE